MPTPLEIALRTPCCKVYSTWTNAPSDYDYSYAMRTGKTKDDGYTGETLHEVLLETCEANASGQVARYRSGVYVATAAVRVEDPVPTDVQTVAAAQANLAARGLREGDIEVDEGATVSRADGNKSKGAYVQAWVWVADGG